MLLLWGSGEQDQHTALSGHSLGTSSEDPVFTESSRRTLLGPPHLKTQQLCPPGVGQGQRRGPHLLSAHPPVPLPHTQQPSFPPCHPETPELLGYSGGHTQPLLLKTAETSDVSPQRSEQKPVSPTTYKPGADAPHLPHSCRDTHCSGPMAAARCPNPAILKSLLHLTLRLGDLSVVYRLTLLHPSPHPASLLGSPNAFYLMLVHFCHRPLFPASRVSVGGRGLQG